MKKTTMASGHWGLGRVIPGVLLLAGLADLGLRAMPVDPLTFRGWEAQIRYRPPGAAFEPDRRYHNPRSYGDLAAMGNLPELRQYRPETFTTDSLGFRNSADAGNQPVSAIVIGGSFTVGSGVSDHENLTYRLSRLAGYRFYNAGGIDPVPDRILGLARKLNMERGLVVHEYHEDNELPVLPNEQRRRYLRALATVDPRLGDLVGLVRGFLTVSPLKIACERAFKRLKDDLVLPNDYAGGVVRATLTNGDPMLFLPSHIDNFNRRRVASAAYWTWLQDELRRGGLDLFVVLVPGKYTVYRRFLVDQGRAREGAGDFLDRLEQELHGAGVPAINLTGPFVAGAARSLEHGEYLYWRDDLHWTPRGTEVAARAIRDKVDGLEILRGNWARSGISAQPLGDFQHFPDCLEPGEGRD